MTQSTIAVQRLDQLRKWPPLFVENMGRWIRGWPLGRPLGWIISWAVIHWHLVPPPAEMVDPLDVDTVVESRNRDPNELQNIDTNLIPFEETIRFGECEGRLFGLHVFEALEIGQKLRIAYTCESCRFYG